LKSQEISRDLYQAVSSNELTEEKLRDGLITILKYSQEEEKCGNEADVYRNLTAET